MSALFSKPKTPPPPKPVKIDMPTQPPSVAATPTDTNAPQIAFLRSRKRGSGLAGLILSPLGKGGGNQGGATKQTLGSGVT